MVLVVKNLPVSAGDGGGSLDGEDPLEEDMAIHFSILAWRIPWTESSGLQSMRSQRVGHDWSDLARTHVGSWILLTSYCICLDWIFHSRYSLNRLPWWLRWYSIWLQCRTWGLIPGSQNPLEKGMANHSSILAWRIPWTEEPSGLGSSVQGQRILGVTKSQTRQSN